MSPAFTVVETCPVNYNCHER